MAPHELPHPVAVIVVAGPSGSGKSTLVSELRKLDDRVYEPISCTTRARRSNEKDGVNYFFIDDAAFAEMVESGELAEYATFSGKSYGTPWSEILKPGKIVVNVMENAGAKSLHEQVGASIVAILPPSEEVLIQRLSNREDDHEEIERRIQIDRERMDELQQIADYTIINDDLHEAAAKLRAIVNEVAGSF